MILPKKYNKGVVSPIVALSFLIIALVLSVSALLVKTNFFSKASEINQPQELLISNLSENSASVSFLTLNPSIFTLLIGENENSLVPLEEEKSPTRLHYFELKRLHPQSKYFFKLGSGSELHGPFTFTTTPIAPNPPKPHEVYGHTVPSSLILITMSDGSSSLLSTYSNERGNYSLDLGNLRLLNMSDYLNEIKSEDKLSVRMISQNLDKKSLEIKVSNAQPIETIMVGQAQIKNNTSASQNNPSFWEHLSNFFGWNNKN